MRPIVLMLAAFLPAAMAPAADGGSRGAREFVQAAAQSDAFEQAEASLMLTASRQPQVRAFAQRMMADHGSTDRALMDAVDRAGLSRPPMAMGADQAHLLAALQGMDGHDLDRAYANQQVLAHRSALVVEQGYAARGDVPALQRVAAAAVPVITAHLADAEALRTALGDR